MLVSRGEFGGMAANDGPVPVRTPAHAARLAARKVGQYGIAVSEPAPDYSRLLTRVRDVVDDVRGEREAATSECYALPRSMNACWHGARISPGGLHEPVTASSHEAVSGNVRNQNEILQMSGANTIAAAGAQRVSV